MKMNKTGLHWLGHSLIIVAAAALSSACANEAPLAPRGRSAFPAQLSSNDSRVVELGTCEDLQAPAGSRLAFHVYAKGVQIHRWKGSSWSFVGPSAVLSADAEGQSTVGIHYSGPTWESVSGSKVVGTVQKRCTPDPNAIPWLSLGAVSSEGSGGFRGVTFIQRVNTVGGNVPSSPGAFPDEVARVPYSAEYLFYRAP
jgi:hypothetical protein